MICAIVQTDNTKEVIMKKMLIQISMIAVFLTSMNNATAVEQKESSTNVTVTEFYCTQIPYGRYNNPSKVQDAIFDAVRTMPNKGSVLHAKQRSLVTIGKLTSEVCVKVKMLPFD